MDPWAVDVLRCPYTGEELRLDEGESASGDVIAGHLVAEGGLKYPIFDGIPHLILAERESYSAEEEREREYYEATARTYDAVIDWLFASFYEDEEAVRSEMVDLLDLSPSSRVLEVGAGTCRDTVQIARRLADDGVLFVQDLSPGMLTIGRDRMHDARGDGAWPGRLEFFIGNAVHLPFADGALDATFHFGGLNLFTDKERALAEMARVVKPGGKVVVGDEGIAPWLREREFGKTLMTSNALYQHEAPLDLLPESARDVSVRWLLGSAFWVIAFTVGEGPPALDLDLPIPGGRGGTHRTRNEARLQGE